MSASTVSITANPATARRRAVVVGEKKSAVEFVTSDGLAAANGGGDDRATSGGGVGVGVGKDLSHSIRGESVLERSRDLIVQAKRGLPDSAAAALPRRTTRKGVSRAEKPRWLTVMSVFTKNFLLVLVLLGLVQMIRRLAVSNGVGVGTTVVPSNSDFEGRIAEVESFLKTTTKMMQVQVEVVDRKIESEIGGLKRELGKRIEDKGIEFAKELKKVGDRTESVEKLLGELRGKDWLSKEDFDVFLEEFKKSKGVDGGNGDANLDEIRAFARKIVEKEIEKHAADGLGRVDYALASGGARVLKHSEPLFVANGIKWFPMANENLPRTEAQKMLRPSFGEPGQCFPLKGSSGFVQIRLRTAIIPEAITLEHIDKSVAYDRSSAPKDCRVSGWLQGPEATEKMFLLTEFTYDLEKSNAQTYNVLDSARSGIIDTIRFDFLTNHGSLTHTCIYRLRVHGHQPDSVSMLPMQS